MSRIHEALKKAEQERAATQIAEPLLPVLTAPTSAVATAPIASAPLYDAPTVAPRIEIPALPTRIRTQM